MKKLTLNISPCPNDTFMFDALVRGKVDCEGLEFSQSFADIEQLNRAVLGESGLGVPSLPDISKISYAVLPNIVERYALLRSGSALGRGNGPLLVSKREIDLEQEGLRIAIPGFRTTAYQLMHRLYPEQKNYTPMLFSNVAKAVLSGDFDAGVLIHEGRFTYKDMGLRLVADLGVEWERTTQTALPLGGIVVSRSLPVEIQQSVERVVRRSVEFAMANPDDSAQFVSCNAQELSPSVTKSHIELFVNEFSVELGEEGESAVRQLTGLKQKDLLVSW